MHKTAADRAAYQKRLKPVIKSIVVQNAIHWGHTTTPPDYGHIEVRVQDNGAFLEGKQ
jgi:hypothetical protein